MRKRLMPASAALVLLALLFLCAAAAADQGAMRFEMVRGHGPDGRLDMKGMLERDVARHRGFAETQRRKALGLLNESNSALPAQLDMTAGCDFGAGQYVVEMKVGTPPKTFRFVTDTGSELTWMRCFYDFNRPRRRRPRVFLPANSSTFTPITCSSHACQKQLAKLGTLEICPSPSSPCQYYMTYLDKSYTTGILGRDTVTADLPNGGQMKLEQVIIGCSQSTKGTLFEQLDGVLGLGNSDRAITSLAGGVFSYCLVDHFSVGSVKGYLTLGRNPAHNSSQLLADMQYTKLVLGSTTGSFYGVDVSGISIGGEMLRIPMQVWDRSYGGGMLVDSDASLTFLAEPAYTLVMEALEPFLSGCARLHEDFQGLEYCFDGTGFNESQVPQLAIVFKDGAKFEPPVKSYVIDYNQTVKCIGFVSIAPPNPSMLGNIMQQEHLWEYDIMNEKLGFAPSLCH